MAAGPRNKKEICYLKTGTKNGPNFGVSFYVCPMSCGFFQQTSISYWQCPQHKHQMVDLQAIFFGKTSGEKRQYHRCHGRTEGQSWCGYSTVKKETVKPLAEYNHQHSLKQTTTDPSLLVDPKYKMTSSKQQAGSNNHNRVTAETNQLRNQSDEGLKLDHVEKEEDIVDGVSNLSIIDESDVDNESSSNIKNQDLDKPDKGKTCRVEMSSDDEGISEAMSNLSTLEDTAENNGDKNTSVSSSSSGSLPSPGFHGKDATKLFTRTDIAEKYGKYKIKKKSTSNLIKQNDEQDVSSSSETSIIDDSPLKERQTSKSNLNLPLSERIRLKSNESIKSSTSSCSSTSGSVSSPLCRDEVINLVSSSDDDEDVLLKQPNRYQPPQDQQQKISQKSETPSSGSESIIKDAMKQVQGQIKSSKQAMPTASQGHQKSQYQSIQPKPSGLTSAAQHSLQLDMDRRTDLQRQLGKLKTVVATVKMSELPDKGEKLRKQVEDIERALKAVNRKIFNVAQNVPATIQGTNTTQPVTNPVQYQTYKIVQPDGQTTMVKMPLGSDSTQPISHHQPHNPQGLKQTSILAHTQTIPPHIMQQLYAANPQAMQLYGGRMTNQRMREVTSITSDAIEKLHKQLETCPDDTSELEDPEGLNVPLMTHQRQALAWLSWRERQQPAGGILADDMGLGKTLTMISMILKQKQMKENGTDEEKKAWLSRDKQLDKLGKNIIKTRASLVICPASVIHQWKTEIERRVKGTRLKICLYHGPNRESDVLRLADNDVVLTTYNLIGKEVGAANINAENPAKDDDDEEEQKMNEMSAVQHKSDSKLLRIAWERIILDEAHNIKNNKSLTAVSVCRLRAGFRWALTGTPIQNQLLDIYSLLRFLRCSPFDEYKLWKKQVDTGKESGHSRLNVLVKCLLLRRTKTQIDKAGKPLVDLPSKTVKEYEIKLSADERKVYEKIYAQSKSVMTDYLKRHEEKEMGITHKPASDSMNPFQDKSPTKTGGHGSQITGMAMNKTQKPGGQMILVMLLRLRQCCCHLSLMKDALEDDIAEDEGLELDVVEQMRGLGLEEESSKEPTLSKSSSVFEKFSPSTKVEAVMKKLKEIRDSSDNCRRQKSVIVSQWTKMLDIIAIHLDKLGICYNVIQGNIPPKKRNEYVEDFNTNPKGSEVMLVSLRAGGVGLNLIGGNHLFLLDQHWNPALEDQACDRIYRVGQTREVMIHRFLCKDTVEEKIVELQQRKKTLATNVLTGSKTTSSKLTLQDLRMIFGV